MDKYYDNCEYVCYSRAIGFGSKTPIPTCRRFHSNYEDPNLRGTYERCCDVAISGRCLIEGAKDIEQDEINLFVEEHNKEIEIRKQLREKGYDTRHY